MNEKLKKYLLGFILVISIILMVVVVFALVFGWPIILAWVWGEAIRILVTKIKGAIFG